MPRARAEASAIIPAPPDQVYAVFADYRRSHPQILPRPYFSDLVVEQGGQGAGTVFRVKTRVLGVERAYHMDVAEPAPGRTLVETDRDTGLATTFTFAPMNSGQQTQVTISTDWDVRPGLGGLMERLMTPPLMRNIYVKQLEQLRSYLQQQQTQTS